MFEAMKQLSDELTQAREEYQKNAKKVFKEALKEFFDAYPDVAAVKWTQYAPYFNDGEPCTFGVNEPELAYVDNADEFLQDYEDESEAAEKIGKLFAMLDEDTMEAAFGSDSVIIAKRSGSLEVDSYGDHD